MISVMHYLETHHFSAVKSGPALIITARIHGNEGSGEIACRRLIADIKAARVILKKGSITFFPCLNPIARDADVRGVEIDMNRGIHIDNKTATTDEDLLRNAFTRELYTRIGGLRKSGVETINLLDLHSVHLPSDGHLITADRDTDLQFAKQIGFKKIYTSWRTAQLTADAEDYKAAGRNSKEHELFTLATIYGAAQMGVDAAVCIEAGCHVDEEAELRAYTSLLSALHAMDMIDGHTQVTFEPFDNHKIVQFEKVLLRRDESEHLIDIEKDSQSLVPGAVFLSGDTRTLTVPDDGLQRVLAHPNKHAKIGAHMGYLAIICD